MISLVAVAASLVLGGCAAGVSDEVPSSSTASQGITGIEEGIDLRAEQNAGDNALNPDRVVRVTPANIDTDMKLKAQRTHVPHPGYEVLGPQFGQPNDIGSVTAIAPQFAPSPVSPNDDPAGQL